MSVHLCCRGDYLSLFWGQLFVTLPTLLLMALCRVVILTTKCTSTSNHVKLHHYDIPPSYLMQLCCCTLCGAFTACGKLCSLFFYCNVNSLLTMKCGELHYLFFYCTVNFFWTMNSMKHSLI